MLHKRRCIWVELLPYLDPQPAVTNEHSMATIVWLCFQRSRLLLIEDDLQVQARKRQVRTTGLDFPFHHQGNAFDLIPSIRIKSHCPKLGR